MDFSVDLAAVGAGSVLAGLAGSFAVDASPPRTAVVGSAGGKSQVASLAAVGAVVLVLAVATGILKDLPEAALGAVLMFVASRLFHFGVLRSIFRFNVVEFALAVITLAVVVFVGIEQGVVTAARPGAWPNGPGWRPGLADAVLGREPGTDHWIQTDAGRPDRAGRRGRGVPAVRPRSGTATPPTSSTASVRWSRPPRRPCTPSSLDADAMPDIDYTGAKALRSSWSEPGAGGGPRRRGACLARSPTATSAAPGLSTPSGPTGSLPT